MINNDIMRSVRYMLKISEFEMVDIVKLGGGNVTQAEINTYIKKEDEPGFVACKQNILSHFLNGLIIYKRGPSPDGKPTATELPTNNVVLKKLRVAFQLKDDDIIAILKEGGFDVSKTEVSALFRKEGHQNYRVCGDQFLRNFLKGLTTRLRGLKD